MDRLKLTTLAERRLRGDLIETFKVVNNKVQYGQQLFKLGRSRRNLINRVNAKSPKDICRISASFISERVRPYWNDLPKSVRNVETVDSFKASLECYKNNTNI